MKIYVYAWLLRLLMLPSLCGYQGYHWSCGSYGFAGTSQVFRSPEAFLIFQEFRLFFATLHMQSQT